MNDLICDTKLYYLSSQSSSGRILNSNPDFKSSIEYNLKPALELNDDDIEYAYVSVPYCVIPNSYYNVSSSNNGLDVLVNGITTTYTFPEGNYNSLSLINDFPTVLGNNWSLSINEDTNRFTITNSTTAFTVLSTSTMDFIFGFTDTISSTLVNSLNTLTFPRVCNFFQRPRINIRCSLLANSLNVGNQETDILASIPNDAGINGKIIYKNNDTKFLLNKSTTIQNFTVNFTGEIGDDLINFSGISSYFAIQIDIYRKRRERPPNFNDVYSTFYN